MSRTLYSNCPIPRDLICLGQIIAAYGIKGWVKIKSYSLRSHVLLSTTEWWLTNNNISKTYLPVLYKVFSVKKSGKILIANLENVLDRNQAHKLRGLNIQVSRCYFPKLPSNEYYLVDLIGCAFYGNVKNSSNIYIGLVQEILDNSSNILLKIICQKSSKQNRKGITEILVPFVKTYIYSVDLTNRRIESNWFVDF